jgi:hypothetical protein
MAQPQAPPKPPPLIIQTTPNTVFQDPAGASLAQAAPMALPQAAPAAPPDVTQMLTKVLADLQSKLKTVLEEAKKLENKRTQLETQEKDLTVKIASENVRHRDELRSLHQAHVQIQAELLQAKQEREKLERERVDKLLQRN